MRIDVEEFYIKTSPFYWLVWVLVAALKVSAFIMGYILVPLIHVFRYFYYVRKYSVENCKTALSNLNKFYKNRDEMPYYYKWAFGFCTKKLQENDN
jgi:hypothetical protein